MRFLPFVALLLALGLCGNVSVSAAPQYPPFLSVDINAPDGPTQAGWHGWDGFAGDWGPQTETFDGVTVTLTGVGGGGNGAGLSSDYDPATTDLGQMYQDWVFSNRTAGVNAMGQHYLKFDFSDLQANQQYEFTFHGHFKDNQTETAHMAWGGVNPAQWLNENVGEGATYTEAGTYDIPMLGRHQMTGLWPSHYEAGDWHYSASFVVTTDQDGKATIFGWNDSDEVLVTTQLVSLTSGFQVGLVPEPASIALLGGGGLLLLARRRRIA